VEQKGGHSKKKKSKICSNAVDQPRGCGRLENYLSKRRGGPLHSDCSWEGKENTKQVFPTRGKNDRGGEGSLEKIKLWAPTGRISGGRGCGAGTSDPPISRMEGHARPHNRSTGKERESGGRDM